MGISLSIHIILKTLSFVKLKDVLNQALFGAEIFVKIACDLGEVMRASYSGNTSGFQPDAGSSILPARSKK